MSNTASPTSQQQTEQNMRSANRCPLDATEFESSLGKCGKGTKGQRGEGEQKQEKLAPDLL